MKRDDKRPRRPARPERKSRLGLWTSLAVILLLAGYLGVLEYSRPHVRGDALRLDTFVDVVERGRVLDARILNVDSYVVGRYERRDGTVAAYNTPYLKTVMGGTQERLIDILINNRVAVTIDQQYGKSLVGPATALLPALIIVVIFVYLILSYRRGTGLFGITSGARKIEAEDARVTFADVAGQDHAIEELREVSQFLSDPERFAAVGAQVPKGILLYGPPGCGKTLIARALAGETGASFYSISGSDFVEIYVGVGASRVRNLFQEARANAPAIVFIDELDSIGRQRSFGASVTSGSNQEQEQSLNQILAEMDGFSPTDGIIVVAATNRPDILDPALLRPGRFDRSVGLERPDEAGRLAILRVHARSKPLDPAADLALIANRATAMTGADLAAVINEAALLAARGGRRAIAQVDLEEALRRIQQAPERQRRLSLRDRSIGRRPGAEGRITYADVAGVDDALEELSEISEYLAAPERFAELGARIPRGILLAGPPGCGKTLLARAVAGEANATFLSAAATEFVEIFVGQGAARVRDLFAEAKSLAPAIVFIDEIDAVGGRRGASLEGHREREQTLNQILIELDGFDARDAVVVIAATNRPDMLDPALVRPGRFDRQVTVELPDKAGRRAILEVHARKKRLAPDADLDAVAAATSGFSGADLANVLNEAALLAARRRQPLITAPVVDEAAERTMLGVSSKRHLMTDEEKRIVAYHEAGHALVGRAVPGARVPHKLSIVPRGRALGMAWWTDEGETYVKSRAALVGEIAMLLGGRVAEEIVFGQPGSGGADDIKRASRVARAMVMELGMGRSVTPLTYHDPAAGPSRYSEDTAKAIDAEIGAVVREATELARRILQASRAALDRVAGALVDQETLSSQEFERIAGPATPVPAADPARTRAVSAS